MITRALVVAAFVLVAVAIVSAVAVAVIVVVAVAAAVAIPIPITFDISVANYVAVPSDFLAANALVCILLSPGFPMTYRGISHLSGT
jgi:hypothetical protein